MASPKGLRNWKRNAPKPRRRHYVLAAGIAVLLWLSLVAINLLWAPQSTHHHLCHDVSSICNDLLPECDGEHVALLRHACPVTCDSCARKPPTFECRDRRAECAAIAAAGRCDVEPLVYWRDCPVSCRICSKQPACHDRFPEQCPVWAAAGECARTMPPLKAICPTSCNACGRAAAAAAAASRVAACEDTDPTCVDWAIAGECDANPLAMLLACPRACALCTQSGGGGAAPAAASRAADADGCTDARDDCAARAAGGACRSRSPARVADRA